MFSLKVGTASQYDDTDANETRLVVPFEILRPVLAEDGTPVFNDDQTPKMEVLSEQKESFALGTTVDEVRANLQNHLTVFEDDFNRFEATRERQTQLDAAQIVADSISNITL